MSDWTDSLQQASFRSVPFAVLADEGRFGRKIGLHEYPYRDKPWAEDLGRGTRRFQIVGFLITDSAVYGGGSVIDQVQKLIGAAETMGTGTLVHPILGELTVTIPEDGLVISGRWEQGRYREFTLTCIEGGDRQFPSDSQDTGDVVDDSADDLDDGAATDFTDDATDPLEDGAAVVEMAVETATSFVAQVVSLAGDATSLFNMLVELPGNFGRYFAGALVGFATPANRPAISATVSSLIDASVASRLAVTTACSALLGAAAGNDTGATAAAGQGVAAALLAACADPADGVRLLTNLFPFYPALPTPPSPTGLSQAAMQAAMAALLRRAALGALGRACAAYQPSSADDAAALRSSVADLFAQELLNAGNSGDDSSYIALRALRAAVITDLDTRGAGLPQLQTVLSPSPTPALALAQRLYQDASRSDELVIEANPAHPAFMPTSFKALGS